MKPKTWRMIQDEETQEAYRTHKKFMFKLALALVAFATFHVLFLQWASV